MNEPKASSPYQLPALLCFALFVLGLGLLALDVFSHVHRVAGWLALVGGAIGLFAVAVWTAIDDAGDAIAAPQPKASAGAGYRDVVHAMPDARGRRMRFIIAGAVVAVVIAQALIPLRYYLGDDKYDERFAWRMFSAVRMQSCQVAASEVVDGTQRAVPLMSTIHEGWQTTLERNREAAIEGYLAWRCEQEGIESARVENHCVSPSGEAVPTIVFEMSCDTGEMRREGGAR